MRYPNLFNSQSVDSDSELLRRLSSLFSSWETEDRWQRDSEHKAATELKRLQRELGGDTVSALNNTWVTQSEATMTLCVQLNEQLQQAARMIVSPSDPNPERYDNATLRVLVKIAEQVDSYNDDIAEYRHRIASQVKLLPKLNLELGEEIEYFKEVICAQKEQLRQDIRDNPLQISLYAPKITELEQLHQTLVQLQAALGQADGAMISTQLHSLNAIIHHSSHKESAIYEQIRRLSAEYKDSEAVAALILLPHMLVSACMSTDILVRRLDTLWQVTGQPMPECAQEAIFNPSA